MSKMGYSMSFSSALSQKNFSTRELPSGSVRVYQTVVSVSMASKTRVQKEDSVSVRAVQNGVPSVVRVVSPPLV